MTINYDFGAEWKNIKHIIINNHEKINIMTKKILKEYYPNEKFNLNHPPACMLASGDSYVTLVDDICDDMIKNKNIDILSKYISLTEINQLLAKKSLKLFWKFEKKYGYNFKFHQDNLAFYIPFGACHTW